MFLFSDLRHTGRDRMAGIFAGTTRLSKQIPQIYDHRSALVHLAFEFWIDSFKSGIVRLRSDMDFVYCVLR